MAIAGVSHVDTDIPARICKFKLANTGLDLVAKLTELAETNSHMADWSMVDPAK